ncbi:hypothetical protein A3D42_01850 [Candidatus Nomurabacteria bacterium RIFCSPHIGHO2_02_FULL_41_18]|uniref:Uncharacterized protein n=1 Tax=Candidatus Nomurabacteria bacterium RIFCSPHIGHO2_02_FULL_41_18 TaxID=1801754 RepID=A0A1F6W7X2_9BACT|nr:MAG: hypothetical protein A2737_01795 [Candidatus Nomurabacteria bacterium RIFCSPHIGHO2_01_FULL_41_71]OGI78001.1 MAG: hypothetical protein A3D42_01850 [Candidatus Nomurabacteria bacterium RIFCSPHIGHO2_02_FULL_41_18]OGI90280.1 MAG: hypothetical protein A3B01_03175 [Candidatus Nomurabacteria bacterium RIFCSPLOWO2_01_FULL_41_52b]OGJ00010.1 MAG: hypothetical protein A3I90_02325 [Candidatus Nomurabacteria bacterium RIFCSPLOWO2_02_FULL_41_9]
MIEIKDLLIGFRDVLLAEEIKKDIIRDVIKKTTGLDIPAGGIGIRNGILRLDIKHIYKNEIFMKREKIIEELKVALKKKSPSLII